MATITKKQVQLSYISAKLVAENKTKKALAVQNLHKKHGLNLNSASDFIENFRYMRQGVGYARTMNGYATDYFLRKIYQDFGKSGLISALKALLAHIEYYESLDRGRLANIREIYNAYDEIMTHGQEHIYPELPPKEYSEGGKKEVTTYVYERDSKARQKCIDHYGCRCIVCSIDFSAVYGRIGIDFIHVHHLKPLSSRGRKHTVDPIKDLRPVCPNCHAMLHRSKNTYTIEQLKTFMKL